MNTTEFDEVYIAGLKEMFKEFDDEIIWNALFEHGYKTKDFKVENVINYLLELSGNNIENIEHEETVTNRNRNRFFIPDKNYDNDSNNNLVNNNLVNNNLVNSNLVNTEDNYKNNEEDDNNIEPEPSFIDSFLNIIQMNNGYAKINDKE